MPQQLVRYAKPTVDIMFKKVFGSEANKANLISFLTELLKLEILDLVILNSEPVVEYLDGKGVRMDVLAELANKTQVNVEIQVSHRSDTQYRSLYYWSKLFSNHLSQGGKYESLRPVISVFITDFKCFKEDAQYLHKFVLKDMDTNQPFLLDKDLLGLYFIELPKFKKHGPTAALDTLEKWILFFQTDDDFEMEELKVDDELILAITELEIAKMNPAERRYYEARIAGIRDYDSGLSGSHKAGLEQGLEQGLQLGRVEGRQEGIEAGAKSAKIQMFKKQITRRFPSVSLDILAKIDVLNDVGIDGLLEQIFDFQTQEEFESALAGLGVLP